MVLSPSALSTTFVRSFLSFLALSLSCAFYHLQPSLSLSISLWRPALGEGYCNTYATRSRIQKTRRKINLVFRLPQRNKFSKFSENRKKKTEKRKTISEVFYCAPQLSESIWVLRSRSAEGRHMQWDSSPSSPTPTTPCGPSESVNHT